ncbi:hypothetical protein [Vibrio barjaei]|uniref:hypothetical protein n=1 Tax=Vibrio barjaei TaxID=1676683 RepID=UPI0022837F30|nr:hypothetical protein [Vibrio barjaei]MCY9872980.1 hypothetical protein [Vibrio barjaei]
MKLTVFMLGMLLSGFTHAACNGDGEACVRDIYSSEKATRLSRTASGGLLSADLPNGNAIEKNVDFSSYATRSSLNSEVKRLEDMINAGLTSNRQDMINHINWLNGRITSLESRTVNLESQGSGGFTSMQTICSNCQFTASSDGLLIINGTGGRGYIQVWDPDARGAWGRPTGAWINRCLSNSSGDGTTSTCSAPIRSGEKVQIGASHGFGSQASGQFFKY